MIILKVLLCLYKKLTSENIVSKVKRVNKVKSKYLQLEAVARRSSVKKLFVKISESLQENTCAGTPLQ